MKAKDVDLVRRNFKGGKVILHTADQFEVSEREMKAENITIDGNRLTITEAK